jgi:hypothetical protein
MKRVLVMETPRSLRAARRGAAKFEYSEAKIVTKNNLLTDWAQL